MCKDIGKNISKNLSGKHSGNALMLLKLLQKRYFEKQQKQLVI